MANLPEMTVEERVSTNSHGVPAPDTSTENLCRELSLAIQMNHDANKGGWPLTTLKILKQYSYFPVGYAEIPEAVNKVLGFNTWGQLSAFVVDDMCLDFFNLALSYVLYEKQPHKQDLGFIDGAGIGYANFYIDDLKITLEKAFDVKWFYKVPRPLVFASNDLQMDLSETANAIHPGHWSYIAGHSTKFITAVYTLNKLFDLDRRVLRNLMIAMTVGAQGRSGSLIHYPMDNQNAIHLFDEDFKNLVFSS